MTLPLILFLSFVALSSCDSKYFIGKQGESCNQVCYKQKMNCNSAIITNNKPSLFDDLGVKCLKNDTAWSSEDQPSFVSNPQNDRYGYCLGYINVPSAGQCSASNSSVQRLCRCDDISDGTETFGTGYSNGEISTKEKWIFQHFVAPGDVGVITHVWITYPSILDPGVIVRYYIDGETKASIEYSPPLACGVGFSDQTAPWGNKYFGKTLNDSGWYNDFKIPFQKSIVITIQHLSTTTHDRFFMVVRGATNYPITVGGKPLPSNAKMNLARIDKTYEALEWIPLVNVPSGPGAHWMVTLAVESGNTQSLEGCIHAYFDGKNEFPGVVLATGAEDYFDSAWFFNGGQFRFQSTGLTHLNTSSSPLTWSAYRFHDNDPLFWKDGFKLIWRNGDLYDNMGIKCHMISGGRIVGPTTDAQVIAYAWYYTWPGPFNWSTVYSIALAISIVLVFLAIGAVVAVKYRSKVPFIQKFLKNSKLTKYMNLNESMELVPTKESVFDSKVL